MNNKTLLFYLFLLLAVVQIYIPAKMAWSKAKLFKTGIDYKFETVPVDPNDPFRGKYITLGFVEDEFVFKDKDYRERFERNQIIYVLLSTTENGYAKIYDVSDVKPKSGDYIKARIGDIRKNRVFIDYPFNRFYLEESKAYPAEQVYRKAQRDSTKTTYALVSVNQGNALLKGVFIDGIPIEEMAENESIDTN